MDKNHTLNQKYVRNRLKHYTDKGDLTAGYPISKQLSPVIRLVQEEVATQFPVLERDEDNWPTRDMISHYLSKAGLKKR